MRIAVIGMGHVGEALGRRWAKIGHDVTFYVRDPDTLQKRDQAESSGASIGELHQAGNADVVLLAVPWTAVEDTRKALGDLSGKIILDCTNPVNPEFTELTIGQTTSAGEEVARAWPAARVVKIFNTNGSTNMADTDYGPTKVSMLFAGDDAQANHIAAQLATEIGFEPIELGPLKNSRLLEPLAMIWILLARHRGFGRDFALNVVRRPAKS